MQRLIQFLKELSFWHFVLPFVLLAIIISELMIVVQSYLLRGELVTDFLIIGFFTPAIDAFIIVYIVAILLETLKHQEGEQRFLLENISAISWKLELSSERFTYISPNAEEILGYPMTQWVNMESWLAMVIPEDRERVVNFYRKETLAGRNHTIEYRMHKGSGEVIWVLEIVTVNRDREGRPSLLTGFIIDNSQQSILREQLEKSQRAHEEAQRIAHIGHWELDIASNRAHWSDEIHRIMGSDPSSEIYLDFLATRVHPEDWPTVSATMTALIEDGTEYDMEYRIIRPDGEERWLNCKGKRRLDERGTPLRLMGVAQDITTQKQAEAGLELAASVFSNASEGIAITDPDGNLLRVNDAFCKITGYHREEVKGKNPRMLQSGRHSADYYTAMWQQLKREGRWSGEIWNRRKSGEVYAEKLSINAVHNEAGVLQSYVALFSDITRQKEHQQQLERIAHYDVLTDLPNRVLLADRLQQAMIQEQRRGKEIAIIFLDLDGFKAINDTYGHDAGDQLLVTLAGRLRMALREGDTIARIGGDEFVAVLIDLTDKSDYFVLIERFLGAASDPVQLGELELRVSASIGVTFYPQPQAEEIDADQLLRQADQAMYQAKLAGKNRFVIFDAEQDRFIRGHQESIKRIRHGLENNEFILFYQPKVNMHSGEIFGAEALIRWQHPQRGLLSPTDFLPAIEEDLLSVDLGYWVIAEALSQLQQWHQSGLKLSVSVNIAALHLQQPDFVEQLGRLLAAQPGIDNRYLELEILETSALEDITHISGVIDHCLELGVTFALDDFGTGYSSLTYLRRLPAATIKIDCAFVIDMDDDAEDLAIVEGVLGLTSAFRLQAVAEGVESVEHGRLLLQLGCVLAQGYGIARPMPAVELPTWAESWEPDPSWKDQLQLDRSSISLLFVSVEHRAWVRRLTEYLQDQQPAPPLLDPKDCRFGQWLIDEGKKAKAEGSSPTYKTIKSLFHKVHALGAELHRLKGAGEGESALARVEELHFLRDQLLQQLTLLHKVS
ncbi:MAG: EAL domain-containing protein [Gammaproteobacteria bacterium]|nr:EAL domain-containing protein [Gammaproteobacteria bacterium]